MSDFVFPAIGIDEGLDYDLDFEFDFDPIGGVSSDGSQDRSLQVCGLHSYNLLVFLSRLINKDYSGLAHLNTFLKEIKDLQMNSTNSWTKI